MHIDENVQQEFDRQRNFLEKQLHKFRYSVNLRNGREFEEVIKLRMENISLMGELEKARNILKPLQNKKQ